MNTSEIEQVRERLNGLLEHEPRLTASSVAREIGFSKATLSKYRRGIYPGNNQQITERLAEWLGSYKIAEEQLAGNLRQMWLVRSGPNRTRLARTRKALDKVLVDYPQSYVITIWLGAAMPDVFFSTGGLPND